MTSVSMGGELVVMQAHVRVGDPHVCSDDRSRLGLLRAVYEPLVRRSAHGRHHGVLAERWVVSDDARVWTFTLRSEACWHDGRAVRPGDVVASLARIRDDPPDGELGTSGVYQSYLAGATFDVPAPDRVRVTLREPMADLLDVLSELAILHAEHVGRSSQLPSGTGPFTLQERGGDEVTLRRFDGYWGAVTPVRTVRLRAEPDPHARLDAVRTGQGDIAADVPLASTGPHDHVRITPGGTTTAFMANLREGALVDRRVRQALNHATDVEAIIAELFAGHADAVASPCTIPQLGFDARLAPYSYDPDRARALLAEAGADRITVRFDVPETLPDEAVALGALLAEQYARVGVTLELVRHHDRAAYADRVREGSIHDAACFDSTPVSSYRLFREKFHGRVQGTWWLGYENEAFDALVDAGATTVDPTLRADTYRRAAALLHEDAPWIYLYAPRWGWALSPAAAEWSPPPEGWVDLSGGRFGRVDHGEIARNQDDV